MSWLLGRAGRRSMRWKTGRVGPRAGWAGWKRPRSRSKSWPTCWRAGRASKWWTRPASRGIRFHPGVVAETQKTMPDEVASAGAVGPSIYSVLQEQLGLKLERRKGPVEILVVDHLDKAPTRN